jgi:hypothetical protein
VIAGPARQALGPKEPKDNDLPSQGKSLAQHSATTLAETFIRKRLKLFDLGDYVRTKHQDICVWIFESGPKEFREMKIRVFVSTGILVAVLALSLCTFADSASSPGVTNEVVYLGNTYCVNQTYCPDFAPYFGIAGGSVEFLGPNGEPAEYIWTNTHPGSVSTLTFEDLAGCLSCMGPPAYDPLLATLHESDMLQQVNQYFPGAGDLPLFVLSSQATPEPSTLLLFGSAGMLVFGRVRRFWRS